MTDDATNDAPTITIKPQSAETTPPEAPEDEGADLQQLDEVTPDEDDAEVPAETEGKTDG